MNGLRTVTRWAIGLAAGLVFLATRLWPAAGDRLRVLSLDREGKTGPAPLLDRLFDERDAAMLGSRLLAASGLMGAREFPALPAVLDAAYARFEATTEFGVTPVVTTLLGSESSERSTTVVVEARDAPASVGVVFLHGFGGNFVLQCAAVARAMPEALTLCPSTSISGTWWTRDGEATVEAALKYLEARGVRRVVLAGLSNGAAGVALLLPRLSGRVDAAILISGVSRDAPTPEVPTLVMQGNADGMMRTDWVRAWASSHAGPRLRYLELPGTHFVLLEQERAVAQAMHEHVFEAGSAHSPPLQSARPHR
jgi:hypothetical protein